MEALLLMLIIIMFAVAITYAGEIYLYISLVTGSFINDIKKSIFKKKK